MTIAPCVTFYGCCLEAVEFYSRVFPVKSKTVLFFRDMNGPFSGWINPQNENLVHSATIRFQCGTVVTFKDSLAMIYKDGENACGNKDNVVFEVSDLSSEEIQHIYSSFMQDKAVANIPLGPRPDNQLYTSFIDRFGVCWNLTGSRD